MNFRMCSNLQDFCLPGELIQLIHLPTTLKTNSRLGTGDDFSDATVVITVIYSRERVIFFNEGGTRNSLRTPCFLIRRFITVQQHLIRHNSKINTLQLDKVLSDIPNILDKVSHSLCWIFRADRESFIRLFYQNLILMVPAFKLPVIKRNKKTLCVVTIEMISNLVSL